MRATGRRAIQSHREPADMKLGLIGVSVRAAAEALGADPRMAVAVDFFADHDTCLAMPDRCCRISEWSQWLDGVSPPAAEPLHWLILGGLDLSPAPLLALQQRGGRWLGCSLECMRFCKSPAQWCGALQSEGLATLPYAEGRCSPPGHWHLKAAWSDVPGPASAPVRWFWQRHGRGTLGSGLFLADANQIRLVGCSRLFVTADYRYLGNQATASWPQPAHRATLLHMAQVLAQQVPLRGLWGIDFMLADQLYPLEINPRPTASVEVLAQLTGRPLYHEHLAACWPDVAEDTPPQPGPKSGAQPTVFVPGTASQPWAAASIVAKRIVYNGGRAKVIQPADFAWLSDHRTPSPLRGPNGSINSDGDFRVADLPPVGTLIPPHEPLCTILATRDDRSPANELTDLDFWRQLPQLLPPHLVSD
jgi:hypothetical protein